MEKFYYLIINFFIILFPLVFSFDKRFKYFRKWKYTFFAILTISPLFIFWDYLATSNGHWSFNNKYILGTKLFGLPFEEILFFVTVPFSCLFIYECVRYWLEEKEFKLSKRSLFKISSMFAILAILFYARDYTFIIFMLCSLFFLISSLFNLNLLRSKVYWIFILVSFVPFIFTNYLLTSFPIVLYNPEAIMGRRFLTIPAEDFFYSFLMLSCYLATYLHFEKSKGSKL